MSKPLFEKTSGRYVIQVVTNNAVIGQKFHVRVLDFNNRQILLSSEKYRDRFHAEKMAERFVSDLQG